jgi:hypothetical protein
LPSTPTVVNNDITKHGRVPLVWLLRIVLKFASGLKSLLLNLSEYPGLRFLGPPGKKLGEVISSYYDYVERSERAKRQIEVSRSKSRDMLKTVTPKGKKSPDDDPTRPQAAARQTEAAENPAGVRGVSPEVPGRSTPTASGSKGTLMLDAFMQNPEVNPELKQRWLEAAAERDQQAPAEPAKPAYYGTLVPPDRRPAPTPLTSPAHPRVVGPLPTDTVGSISATYDATAPSEAIVPHSEAQQDVSAARWMPPLHSDARLEASRPVPGPLPALAGESVMANVSDAGSPPVHITDSPVQAWPPQMPVSRELAERASVEYRPAPPQIASARYSQDQSGEGPGDSESYSATVAGMLLEDDQPAIIPLAERQQQLARLEYVCQRLRESRQPLCPLNGALALLPLGAIEAGPREAAELPRAVRADLDAVQKQLKLRFPVSALAVGWEEDRGFEELVRRVGPERAKSQRFGHRFDMRSTATPSQLAILCARISGVFEDWVYAIFRERGSVARAGNAHLFGLLCNVRTQLLERLKRILTGGFGHDPEQAGPGEPVAFSGCYFAATGRTEDRRAFVQGVFDKLQEEQDKLEWTAEARREDKHLRRVGWLGLWALSACGIALIVSRWIR